MKDYNFPNYLVIVTYFTCDKNHKLLINRTHLFYHITYSTNSYKKVCDIAHMIRIECSISEEHVASCGLYSQGQKS